MRITAIILILTAFLSPAFAQTIVKDSQGNYSAIKSSRDSSKTADINTGKTFTDVKGGVWPVYQTKSGRVYALRTSKTGNTYKQYLDKPLKQ